MSAHEEAWRELLAAALRERAAEAEATPCDEECDPEDCPSCGQPVQALSFYRGEPDTIFASPEALADALLPTVRAIADQRAAEELEGEAAYDDAAPDEQYARRLFAQRLRVRAKNLRAAALAATTHTDTEGQRDA